VDSAVTSALCARTGLPVIAVSMPILQKTDQNERATEHLVWLRDRHPNVTIYVTDLSRSYLALLDDLPECASTELGCVNSRSRLRMTALYAYANSSHYMVCGTGNKVEDFGIGFFTKYGDGGVDLSPIGDLLKSEVYELARYIGVPQSIQAAAPTDGLWEEDRTDEAQIGASYDEIEWAMHYCKKKSLKDPPDISSREDMTPRQKDVLSIYLKRHRANRHKMTMPPVCTLNKDT